jgi:flagellar biosynthesis protein FliP
MPDQQSVPSFAVQASRIAALGTFLLLCLAPLTGVAEPVGLQAVTVTTDAAGGQSYSLSIQVLLLMTMLTLLPAILLTMTSFTRIVIVLAILRQALGTAQSPPNQVLIGLSLFLSFFVMSPVLDQAYERGIAPYLAGDVPIVQGLQQGVAPLREFMLAQTRQSDLDLFARLAGDIQLDAPEEVPLRLLVPAFVTSELKTAFQIGFLIFIPFVVIDLVVASVLMSMGMMMLSPMLISLPFKLMLFVMVDGWALLVETLAASFYA